MMIDSEIAYLRIEVVRSSQVGEALAEEWRRAFIAKGWTV
jgi:hypothetical protein